MTKKTAFITGVLGQDGSYLAALLLEKGYRVYGMCRRHSRPDFSNTDFVGITNDVEFVTGDMGDSSSLLKLIKSIRPDEVYNLAAQSFVGASWDLSDYTTDVNALGTLRLLEAIRTNVPYAKFYQASTSEMFGLSNAADGQAEDTPFHPRSPYGVSKVYAYWITRNFRESYKMYTSNGILFNHESPIRGKEFVTRKITDGVAKIRLGLSDSLSLGNMDARRDWGFAGDYVEAMWKMLQHEKPDDFVVATGETHSVKEFVAAAFKHAEIQDWEQYIKIDPRFKRPAEVPELRGNADKAKKELSWKSKTPFNQLVEMMVDADLERYGSKIVKKTIEDLQKV